ncbi:MAG: hypothetical protein IJW00_07690 [Clostridia bacterium]|nr:hypothetical protein [Clostridia bacterium]
MPQYTLEEYASFLTKTFSAYRPRVIYDTTDKGEAVMEFLIPNPAEPRFSVSLQAGGKHKWLDACTLWFGQAEISGHMDPDMVPSAINTILNNELVAILRYKNRDDYDDHRPAGNQWLYQFTDDEDDDREALEKMKAKISSPPSLIDKLSGKLVGVFEIFSWSRSEVIER